MSGLKRLIHEIHRRSLWQVLGIYLLASWVVFQVVQTLTEGLGLPEWFPPFALVLLLIGLPIVLATAFVQEGAGRGAAQREPSPEAEDTVAQTRERAKREARGVRRMFTWRNAIMGGALAFGLWGVVATAWLLVGERSSEESLEAASARKMLVVLPFQNLGAAEDDYFADGITDEVTARLAMVDGLGVIARQSAMQYKGSDKTPQQIGDELDVQYILEATISWEGPSDGPSRVRLRPQLINAADATHLWAGVFDEELTSIFDVLSGMAERVVDELDIALLEPDRRSIQSRPTENLEAYDYYLRGLDYFYEAVWGEQALRFAIQMYDKAIELDPEFALAFARLAEVHSGMYWWYFDRSDERLANAKAVVDRAFELEPDLPEAHAALGWYYYWGFLDYQRALEHFAIAERDRPNDARLYLGIGSVRRRQGEFEQATLNFEKAVKLDPRSATSAANLGETYALRREFTQAERYLDRAISLRPDAAGYYAGKALSRLRGQGNPDGARAVLDRALEILPHTEDSRFRLMTVVVELSARNYDDALHRLAAPPFEAFSTQFFFIPKALLYAQVYGLMKEAEVERAYYDSARVVLEAELQERPEDARLHSALGIAYAGLERIDDAIREGELGVELLPVTVEARRGPFRVEDLARIYTMVGEYDKAIEQLEYLLSIPGEISGAWLRIDPTWDPLRHHPRFQALLEKYEQAAR